MKDWMRHPIAALDNWWVNHERRIDHNPANIFMIAGLMTSSLSVILQGAPANATINGMSPNLQIAMCFCIFTGLGIKLHGVLSHTRFYLPRKSLRKCYQNGYTGAPLGGSGMLVYGWYILSNTPTWASALGSMLVAFLGIGVMAQGIPYWLEARRIEHNETAIIKQVKQVVIDERNSHNDDSRQWARWRNSAEHLRPDTEP